MARGLTRDGMYGRKDAGGIDALGQTIGPEGALAVSIIRQAVTDWQRTRKSETQTRRLRKTQQNELTNFFGSAWFAFISAQLDLDAQHIVERLGIDSEQHQI